MTMHPVCRYGGIRTARPTREAFPSPGAARGAARPWEIEQELTYYAQNPARVEARYEKALKREAGGISARHPPLWTTMAPETVFPPRYQNRERRIFRFLGTFFGMGRPGIEPRTR